MTVLGLPTWVVVVVLNVVSVLLIVQDRRLPVERRLRRAYGVDRDWWIPPIALGVAAALSIVDFEVVRTTFVEKFDILVLIFSFGIMSEGLGASGFFRYIAYKVVEKCEGNTARLTLYLYVMTSAVTLFTTNDIVVLVITPIIVTICFQAGIINTKLLLLSQFVAANTLSMGLLIGSPTNIIVAEQLSIDFFTYAVLMFLPALVAFGASFVVVDWFITASNESRFSLLGDFQFQQYYQMPPTNPEPFFTDQMRDWILIFGTFVVLVAVVTFYEQTLLLCAIPAILISLVYWLQSDEHDEPVREPIKRLPYGVFFFGMTFFIFAEVFTRTPFVTTRAVPVLERTLSGTPSLSSLATVYGAGIMVNVFNDLPAAAIVAELLATARFNSFLVKQLVIQGSLVGLNIGTYVTQVGALAGLIWFNQLRIERERKRSEYPELAERMEFPDRIDLLRYGAVHFVVAGAVTGLFLVFEWVLFSFLVGPYAL